MPQQYIPDDIRAISVLSDEFHGAGVLGKEVILKIFELAQGMDVRNTVETGSGKSTLLFSQISPRHVCFTFGINAHYDDRSVTAVRQSPLFNKDCVEFVLGPTQKTLPAFTFSAPCQIVFLDGPHGFPFPELEYYYLYPQLETGGLLIVDDIHIPTIGNLVAFLKDDAMFEFVGKVATTAFFRRTSAPLFDPLGDGWWLQHYNARRMPRWIAHGSYRARLYRLLAKYCGTGVAEKARLCYRRLFPLR